MSASEVVPGCSFLDPSRLSWQIVHVLCFALGGFTFIIGTLCYFDFLQAYDLGAWLYIIGSCGFLGVDVLELATYYKLDKYLTINICLSVTGSTLYILGSIGFLPSMDTDGSTSALGIWGFILGSFFIGTSQLWKVLRIGGSSEELDQEKIDPLSHYANLINEDEDDRETLDNYNIVEEKTNIFTAFRWSNLFRNEDNRSAFGVEFSACLGGWFFFFGTIMDDIGTPSGAYFTAILIIWTFGSIFFSLGAIWLAYRHFKLNL